MISGALKSILLFVKKSLNGFTLALFDEERMNDFLLSKGWFSEIDTVDSFRNALGIYDAIENVITLANKLENSDDKIDILANDLIPVLENLFEQVGELSSKNPAAFTFFPLNQSEFWTETAEELIDFIIVSYLENNQKAVFSTLHLLGIIEFTKVEPSQAKRFPYVKKVFNWNKLGELITDPFSLIKETYNWNPGVVEYDKLFEVLQRIGFQFEFQSTRRLLSKETYDSFYNNYALSSTDPINEVEFPVFSTISKGINGFNKLSFVLAPGVNAGNVDGLLIIPHIVGFVEFLLNLHPNLILEWNGYFSDDNIIALQLLPHEKSKLLYNGTSNLIIGSKITVIYAPPVPALLFGKESKIGLYNNGYEISLGINGSIDDPEIVFKIGNGDIIKNPNFIFVYDPSGGDSFITKILGLNPFAIEFGVGIGWSSKYGIGFEGNVGFSIAIPLNKDKKSGESKFPIKLNTIRINGQGGTNGNSLAVGLDIDFNLSVISATIRDIGAKIVFENQQGTSSKGILNNLDINFDFKFPTGVGLAIDAPPVSGGGFLNYDEATYTYTGGLELNFSKISFSAIGIISTKLPGGEDGYSLLIIITAEFGPLPIGMGFTLNGLGGLMGLNRTMNPEFLREGIKNNTLDSILFPHDIVKNANTIISNIGQAFPILKDQFVIGPMAKIGWGTPTLITIELGIMIELPNPVRLAILGVLKAILPTESKPVLQIQVNFLGIIDFDNKYISFDASLYDSKILTFGLFGDMALRLYWGDQPNFLLSVGGFHPKFTPPPLNLPTMRRLSIVLANQSNLKIAVETYFAITSNSVQFGAKVAAMAKAWKIQAIGALWFDILFQFSPFHFIADMGAMFAIKMGSKTILSIFIDLSLEGPHPWKAQGRGSFKILFVRVNVSFDKTFGSANVATIPPVAIDDKFTDALKSKDNWQALVPERNSQQVACREIAAGQIDKLVVDPGGSLRFSQNLLPLDTTLEKFGNSAISDYDRYSISALNHSFALSLVQDYFARNSFFYLSDDDKLSRPSYELFNSGIIAGATAINSKFAVHRLCDYEEITLDSGYRQPFVAPWVLLEADFEIHVFENYVSNTKVAEFDKIPTEKGWPGKVQLNHEDDDFVLVNRNDLSQAISQNFSSSVEAERALQEYRNSQPAQASEWIVANRFELA